MTFGKFETLLDQYGPDLARWPADERAIAAALLRCMPAARKAHEDAFFVAQALDSYETIPPSATFEARLLDLAPPASGRTSPGRSLVSRIFDLRILTSAGAALACTAFGLIIGFSSLQSELIQQDADAYITASNSDYDSTFWLGDGG
jgi:hypothetical protein